MSGCPYFNQSRPDINCDRVVFSPRGGGVKIARSDKKSLAMKKTDPRQKNKSPRHPDDTYLKKVPEEHREQNAATAVQHNGSAGAFDATEQTRNDEDSDEDNDDLYREQGR